MKGPEHALLKESSNAFLAKADHELCERLVDYLICDRNPAYLLTGNNPLLLRYYARLVANVMRAAGHKVFLCPPLLHREIPQFLSRIAAEKTVEAAMEPVVSHRHLLVFMHTPRIRSEELVLLREVQRNFQGLGLAYLYLGTPDLTMEASTTTLSLDEAAAKERLAHLESPAAIQLAPRRLRHLGRILRSYTAAAGDE
jgi:hypothetical protein